MANYVCETCADSGVVKADLVKVNGEDGKVLNEKVNVHICGEHYDTSLSEKTITLLEDTTGLLINVVGVIKKQEEGVNQ